MVILEGMGYHFEESDPAWKQYQTTQELDGRRMQRLWWWREDGEVWFYVHTGTQLL